jgi:hypothetical protein
MRWLTAVLLFAVGCHRPQAESGSPDAASSTTNPVPPLLPSISPSALASALAPHPDDEEDPVDAAAIATSDAGKSDGGMCVASSVHPGYCRRRCRGFEERKSSMHARRVGSPKRAGIGTCGSYSVFAEDGQSISIVEYFDSSGSLVAVRERTSGCVDYGSVPACAPVIKWAPSRLGASKAPL